MDSLQTSDLSQPMSKTIVPTHFLVTAYHKSGYGGAWGQGDTLTTAISNCKTSGGVGEFQGFASDIEVQIDDRANIYCDKGTFIKLGVVCKIKISKVVRNNDND